MSVLVLFFSYDPCGMGQAIIFLPCGLKCAARGSLEIQDPKYRQKFAKFCGVEKRAPPIFGRAAITLGIGPQSSFLFFGFMRI